jgi:hypothetical protein
MESRPFRLAGGANMEKVVRMDREITRVHIFLIVLIVIALEIFFYYVAWED